MSEAIQRVRFSAPIIDPGSTSAVPKAEFAAGNYDITLEAGVFTIVAKAGGKVCCNLPASWVPMVVEVVKRKAEKSK